MIEFSLFRIPVRVEMSFWIILGLLGILWNQNDPDQMFVKAGLFLFAAFVSVLVHEMGHALMIRKFKLPTQVVLSSFGGYATYPAGVLSRFQSILVSLAGPFAQALAGALVWGLFAYYIDLPPNKMRYLVSVFVGVSFIWALFNCLPVIPMDGGRVVEAALGPRRIKITLLISMITAAVVGVLGLMNGYMFVGIFMMMYGWQSYQAYEQIK